MFLRSAVSIFVAQQPTCGFKFIVSFACSYFCFHFPFVLPYSLWTFLFWNIQTSRTYFHTSNWAWRVNFSHFSWGHDPKCSVVENSSTELSKNPTGNLYSLWRPVIVPRLVCDLNYPVFEYSWFFLQVPSFKSVWLCWGEFPCDKVCHTVLPSYKICSLLLLVTGRTARGVGLLCIVHKWHFPSPFLYIFHSQRLVRDHQNKKLHV